MKAIIIKENGGIENLKLTEIGVPSIASDEVLIKVKAIGINPVDAFVRQYDHALRTYCKPKVDQDTFILGWDVSGTVTHSGDSVTEFNVGDAVFGMINFQGQGNAYAEYVAAPADQIALKPKNVSHEEAAGATLAALTAWQSLVTYGKVKKGDNVLIHAAAGGVGHYAVQIAKHFGAYVIGTASALNRNFVLELGADEFIDYQSEKFEERIQDADLVIDSIYGDHVLRSLDAVKLGGRVITLLTPFEGAIAVKANAKEVFAHVLLVASNGADMKQISKLLEQGHIKTHISGTYSFEEIPKAHQQIETKKTKGKIVISL